MSNTKFDPQGLNEDALNAALLSLSSYYIPKRRLKLRETTLGRGGFGIVRLAELRPSSLIRFLGATTTVAVKELQTGGTNSEPLRTAVRLTREMKVWASCKHPNILQFTGYYLSGDFKQAYLISPYMKNGNIEDYLAKTNPSFERRVLLVLGTIMGLHYLHTREPPIVHGDLKPLNVLLNANGDALLSDFGLARVMADTPTGLSTSNGFKGTVRYCSPEVLMGNLLELESDIWSWGCLALKIFTDKSPYHEYPTETEVLLLICGAQGSHKTPEPSDMSSAPHALSTLLRECWKFEPSQRPDAVECLDKVRSVAPETS